MSDQHDSAPPPLAAESTASVRDKVADLGERIAGLEAGLAEYKEHTPTFEQLRDQLTGLRSSITAQAVAYASKEAVDREVTSLKVEIDRIRPPAFWKLVGLALASVLTIGGIIWNASGRISDMALQNALLQRDIRELGEKLQRLETSDLATAGKLDQLLLQKVKP